MNQTVNQLLQHKCTLTERGAFAELVARQPSQAVGVNGRCPDVLPGLSVDRQLACSRTQQ